MTLGCSGSLGDCGGDMIGDKDISDDDEDMRGVLVAIVIGDDNDIEGNVGDIGECRDFVGEVVDLRVGVEGMLAGDANFIGEFLLGEFKVVIDELDDKVEVICGGEIRSREWWERTVLPTLNNG